MTKQWRPLHEGSQEVLIGLHLLNVKDGGGSLEFIHRLNGTKFEAQLYSDVRLCELVEVEDAQSVALPADVRAALEYVMSRWLLSSSTTQPLGSHEDYSARMLEIRDWLDQQP